MKNFLTISMTILFLTSVATAAEKPKCQKQAESAVLEAAKKAFPGDDQLDETRSIFGSRLLHKGGILETYLVGYSDEVEPSDWIAVLDAKKGCKIKFVDETTDASSEF